jgi:N-acetylmuramoyl-L-alanine amidase
MVPTARPTSPPTPTATATPTPTPEPTPSPTPTPTPSPTPSPSPTVSPSPIPIHHGPPYLIAIEAGHGGPYYWGASARDADNRLWIEKDLNLEVAQRVQQLLSGAGYNTLMIRTDDSTLTQWDPADYRGSLIREAQARVDVANAAQADVYLAVHFNGWVDDSQKGTEAYCNPDRSFGTENCSLATFVQAALVQHIRDAGYDVNDRGVKNDADVGGNPNSPHSFALGTNDNFSPTLMPGVIVEPLFLSNPDDLGFLHRDDAIDIIASGYVDGLNAYFAWLNGG